jgi:putative transposase
MQEDIFKQHRKSFIEIGKIYFWTATIHKWQHLLQRDEFKNVVLKSLEDLSTRGKIDVFAFVIMPNHVHLIWRINEYNGKETAQVSFLKYTAHEFKKKLKLEMDGELFHYAVDAHNKAFEFWQRDSLAVNLFTQKVAYQKLNHLHFNPVQDHWKLVNDPCDYPVSTAKFYMLGVKEFDFIKDLREEF